MMPHAHFLLYRHICRRGLGATLRRHPVWMVYLDKVLMALIGGLFLLQMLPHAFKSIGFMCFGAALVGVSIPWLFERGKNIRFLENVPPLAVTVIVLALGAHALLDGAALSLDDDHGHGHSHSHEGRVGLDDFIAPLSSGADVGSGGKRAIQVGALGRRSLGLSVYVTRSYLGRKLSLQPHRIPGSLDGIFCERGDFARVIRS